MAIKKCKECGAEISSSAKECPKCGKNQKNFFQRHIILTIILIIVVIGIIGGACSTDNPTTSSNNVLLNSEEQEITYTAIDVDTLENDLKTNAAAAKDLYNNKYFEITGTLGTIDSDLKYISLLSTTDEFDLIGIHCTIKNDEQKEIVKSLKSKEKITVKGKITNVGEVFGYYLDITEISK